MANSISVAVGDSDTMRRGRCAMVTVVPPGCAIETGKRVPGDALLVAGDEAQALRNNSATTTTLGTRAAGFAPALCSCVRMRQPPAATVPPRGGNLAARGTPTDPRRWDGRSRGLVSWLVDRCARGRLPKTRWLSGRWPEAPHSQLRDSSGLAPDSRAQ